MGQKRHPCSYAKGNGATYFVCSKNKQNCKCQRWCTLERRFKPTACSKECADYKD